MPVRDDLLQWLVEGRRQHATHMIVVCDSFEYSYYPVYVPRGTDVREKESEIKKKDMQRVMEVYALHLDLQKQLDEHRAFHYEYPTLN